MGDEPMKDVAQAIDAVMLPDPQGGYCARHLEPFRETWPAHYGIFAVLIFQHVTADDRFTEPLHKNSEGLVDATNEQITARLKEISPLCCFVGDAIVVACTARAFKGKAAMS